MPLTTPSLKTVRIPLVGAHNQRPATAGAFLDKDQRFINFIPTKEQNPLTESTKYYCLKRPGFESYATSGEAAIGTALHVWEGSGSGTTLISAWGATNSAIYENTTDKGDITGKARGMIEVDFTGTSTIVISSTDSTAWYYPAGGALTEITDADFPATTVGNFVAMDGYLFIMRPNGDIYNSDLNSITAWTSTSFLTPTLYTFEGVGLARHHDSVVAFGKSAIEFYINAGNATGSPLIRRDSLVRSVGAVLPAGNGVTIVQHQDDVYFVGTSRAGGGSIYRLRGFDIQRISTPVIDAQIEVSEPQNVTLTIGRWWGRTHLVVHAGQTYCLNIEDNVWWEMSPHSDVGTFIMAGATHGDGRLFALSTTGTTGKIFELNTDTPVYQDNASAFTATVQTSKIDLDKEVRKRFHKLSLIGDKQASTTTVGISWSDDDYGTFSTVRNVDMSNNRAYLTNCGIGRRRALKFTNSTNTPCRLEAIELVYTELER